MCWNHQPVITCCSHPLFDVWVESAVSGSVWWEPARGWRNSGLCCGSKGRRAPRNREAYRWRGAPWLSPKWGPGSKAMGPPGRMNMHHYELPAICCENQSTLLKPTLKQKARQLKALSCSVFLAGNCWGPAEQSKLRLWEWGWQQSSEMVPVLGAVEWEESRCSRTQLNDWALTKWTPSSWDSQLQLLVKVRILWCQLVEAPDDEKAGTCARPKSFQIIRALVWSFVKRLGRSAAILRLREQALCDARAQIFRVAVRGVKDTIPDGFAAIKLSGLGRLGGMDHG